jgi:hypothetical protein
VAGRVRLNHEEFARLFSDPAEAQVAPQVRAALGPHVTVPVELVRPDGRVAEELCLGDTGIDEPDAFLDEVSRVTGTTIPEAAALDARTVRDIIQFIARQGAAGNRGTPSSPDDGSHRPLPRSVTLPSVPQDRQ